jgi:Icc protein
MKNKFTNNKIIEVRHLAADADHIEHNHENDGVDRRGFLKCMAWAGTGMLWTVAGGVLGSRILNPMSAAADDMTNAMASSAGDFSFVQISDSHIGFSKPANTDVVGTLKQAIAKINALPQAPDFILHTGDLTHLSEPEEFDTLDQLLKTTKAGQVFYVPGEHDVISDNGKEFRARHGKGTLGNGWFSFNQRGVHFIGLVNVLNIAEGGLGILGEDQLAWLKDDLSWLSDSTPIVVFAHVPLWTIYPQWGWGTQDAERALGYLKRFGSVTVLNGHIHQTVKKVEGPRRWRERSLSIYLAGLMLSVGCSGRLLGAGAESAPTRPRPPELLAAVAKGHQLYLQNCAHCHASDATGDEGPDLHEVDRSDAEMAALITNGKKGKMPRFSEKLNAENVQQLIQFLHSLNAGG